MGILHVVRFRNTCAENLSVSYRKDHSAIQVRLNVFFYCMSDWFWLILSVVFRHWHAGFSKDKALCYILGWLIGWDWHKLYTLKLDFFKDVFIFEMYWIYLVCLWERRTNRQHAVFSILYLIFLFKRFLSSLMLSFLFYFHKLNHFECQPSTSWAGLKMLLVIIATTGTWCNNFPLSLAVVFIKSRPLLACTLQ